MRYDQAMRARRELGPFTYPGAFGEQNLGFRGQSFAGFTGIMAAGLAGGSTIFAGCYAPPADTLGGIYFPDWLHIHYECLANFGAPVFPSRRLSLRRGSCGLGFPWAAPSGGTAIDVMPDISTSTAILLSGQVATTTALTMTGITYAAPTRCRLMLSQAGVAGNDYDEIWKFDGFGLLPGEMFGVVAPIAFDAGGTWQVSIQGHGYEMPVP